MARQLPEQRHVGNGEPAACVLAVRAIPNASRSQVVGWHAGALKVKVMAPPEGGRANKEIESLLARVLGVSARSVSVVSGNTSREKQIRVEGLTREAVEVIVDKL